MIEFLCRHGAEAAAKSSLCPDFAGIWRLGAGKGLRKGVVRLTCRPVFRQYAVDADG